jgi:hypothetical protein
LCLDEFFDKGSVAGLYSYQINAIRPIAYVIFFFEPAIHYVMRFSSHGGSLRINERKVNVGADQIIDNDTNLAFLGGIGE